MVLLEMRAPSSERRLNADDYQRRRRELTGERLETDSAKSIVAVADTFRKSGRRLLIGYATSGSSARDRQAALSFQLFQSESTDFL